MIARTMLATLVATALAALAAAAPPPSAPPRPSRDVPPAPGTGPTPYLVLQNRYSADPLQTLGVSGSAVCVSGSYFKSSRRMSINEFIEADEPQVQKSLTNFFAGHPHVSRLTHDIVVVDIEYPVEIMKLGDHLDNPRLFSRIVQAFRMRYRVARQVMPNARLAQYGFYADHRGDATDPKFVRALEGVKEAARRGMFDELDYICPTLYLRYGATDPNYRTIEAYTRLGLEAFAGLQRTNGTVIDLFPLLSFRVFNGVSKHRRQLATEFDPTLEHSLGLQVRIIRESGVSRFGFWNARESLDDLDNPRHLTMMEVLATALGKPVPPRSVTVPPPPPPPPPR